MELDKETQKELVELFGELLSMVLPGPSMVQAVYRTPAQALREQANEIERREALISKAQYLWYRVNPGASSNSITLPSGQTSGTIKIK